MYFWGMNSIVFLMVFVLVSVAVDTSCVGIKESTAKG